MSRWLSYPAYIFRIEEVYDNSATKNGFGKRTELDEYRVQTRGGKGVITYKITGYDQ